MVRDADGPGLSKPPSADNLVFPLIFLVEREVHSAPAPPSALFFAIHGRWRIDEAPVSTATCSLRYSVVQLPQPNTRCRADRADNGCHLLCDSREFVFNPSFTPTMPGGAAVSRVQSSASSDPALEIAEFHCTPPELRAKDARRGTLQLMGHESFNLAAVRERTSKCKLSCSRAKSSNAWTPAVKLESTGRRQQLPPPKL